MSRKFVRQLRFGLTGPRMLAFLPVVILSSYLLGGVIALVVVATVLPSLIAVALSFRQPIAQGHERDPLTGLTLRDGLIDWIERALPRADAQGTQVAVLSITIDHLDTIEARFGHAMYDKMVSEAVERVRALLRDDDVIARIGQKLVVAVDNLQTPETENLLLLAERLQSVFEEPFSDGPTRTYCSVSLGIAGESHVKSASGANILTAAQRASELAAVSGPGSIRFYNDGLSSDEAVDRNMARELSNALETNEIFAWFQPQIRVADGRVTGFEALARWDHPEKGMMAPASFLPEIEKAGLSQRLAEVILKQSLMALSLWDSAGYDVPTVSVNFSAEELRNPRLPDYVRWELDRHNIAPNRLVIEILESVASASSEDVISRTIHALSRTGCRIDLDDFGTGFTSFVNIRRFNVDRVKIDRSLVNEIDKDEAQHTMFSALLAFGDRLGVDTLAEGVETQGEVETLHDLGCRDMQGYAVSRPLPLGEAINWLEERRAFDASHRPNTLKTA